MARFHYQRRADFMSAFEKEFFITLLELAGDAYYICPQIHVGNLIEPQENYHYRRRAWLAAYFAIDKYSIDFVVCTRERMQPVLAIELDDWSHLKRRRRRRDNIVRKMMDEARLPLLHITIDDSRDNQLVRNALSEYLSLE